MILSSTPKPHDSTGRAKPVRDLWIFALLLAFPSTGFIQKYTGLIGVATYLAAVIGMVFLTYYIERRFAPWLRLHFRSLAALLITLLATGFVVLHPLEDGKGPGKSSDRDEGLEMAVTRIVHGESPYYPSNSVAGPLSVLPGSMLLAAPFVALGNSGYQNVFWLAVFLFTASQFFNDKALALYLLMIPLALSIAAQYEFISGGDLIANGIFVALLLLFAIKSWANPSSPGWQRWLSCLLVGVALASRANYILLIPLLGAAMWRLAGMRNAIAASAFAVLVAAAITLPFYLHDPAGFTPLLTKQKLSLVDRSLPWASTMIIGITVMASVLSALWLLKHRAGDPVIAFFRCCTLVTIAPIVCAVMFSSWINNHLDFSFLRDRFGLMYIYFAILGWGASLIKAEPNAPKSEIT